MSSIASFVILSTMLSFACDAAKTFKSSMYSRFVTLDPTGLESLQPSVERNFHATGFKHNVNMRGHSASPWGRRLLKLITGEVSLPTLVLATM